MLGLILNRETLFFFAMVTAWNRRAGDSTECVLFGRSSIEQALARRSPKGIGGSRLFLENDNQKTFRPDT
jgi:hypothetical protein